jgi:hypothetical protein
MGQIIFTSRYLRGASKPQLKNLVEYMAKRPGVAVDESISASYPATKSQKGFIAQILKLVPETGRTSEYMDYTKNPTKGKAEELIQKFVEDNLADADDIKHYIDYIAKRPKAERTAGAHGLWNGADEPISLVKVADEVSNRKGAVFTHVISLRREDADRLGYNNAAAWRSLITSKAHVMADAMNIPFEDFKWYAAFHDADSHPHVHVLAYSTGARAGYLSKAGIDKMRSAFATEIFKQDLYNIYDQKTAVRQQLNASADVKVREIAERIRAKPYDNVLMEQMILRLSAELRHVRGRKVYGNLKGADKQTARNLVDAIVAELGKTRILPSSIKSGASCKPTLSAFT